MKTNSNNQCNHEWFMRDEKVTNENGQVIFRSFIYCAHCGETKLADEYVVEDPTDHTGSKDKHFYVVSGGTRRPQCLSGSALAWERHITVEKHLAGKGYNKTYDMALIRPAGPFTLREAQELWVRELVAGGWKIRRTKVSGSYAPEYIIAKELGLIK